MNKNRMIFTLTGFVLAAGLALSAEAAPSPHQPEGGCEAGNWALIPIRNAKDRKDAMFLDKGGNEDGFVCEKKIGNQYSYQDNDEPF